MTAPGHGLDALLVPWLAARVVACDADVLVVDKPHGLPVHGGDAAHGGDVVGRLAAWLEARGEDARLGVHQRLDQDASGILLFTRARAADARIAALTEEHRLQRGYLAVVTDPGLPAQGELVDRLEAPERGQTRVVRQGGKEAVTRFRVLETGARRALVELRPVTGRRHQLRAQLAHVKAPIAGDALYGGARAARLMLHAFEIEAPGMGAWSVPVPASLAAALAGGVEPTPRGDALAARIADAGMRRWPQLGRASAWRLLAGAADGVDGAVVDAYDAWAVAVLANDDAPFEAALAEMLSAAGARGVYVKRRPRPGTRPGAETAPADPVVGEAAPEAVVVVEGELRFEARLGEGLHTGLFVDQRDNRELVRRRAKGARFLNLFAHTGSFTIAAAVGGARETVSVDVSRRALAVLRRNLELNGVSGEQHHLLVDDAREWLRRAKKKRARFELVVLDPPSFAGGGKKAFSVERDYTAVAGDALALLAPGGALVAVTNHRGTSRGELRKLLHDAARAARRSVTQMKDLSAPLDCSEPAGAPEGTKSVLLTVA